jgi:hypothetical protein
MALMAWKMKNPPAVSGRRAHGTQVFRGKLSMTPMEKWMAEAVKE